MEEGDIEEALNAASAIGDDRLQRRGRGYVTPDDVKEAACDVMKHRIRISYEAEAESITSEDIIRKILDTVPVP